MGKTYCVYTFHFFLLCLYIYFFRETSRKANVVSVTLVELREKQCIVNFMVSFVKCMHNDTHHVRGSTLNRMIVTCHSAYGEILDNDKCVNPNTLSCIQDYCSV